MIADYLTSEIQRKRLGMILYENEGQPQETQRKVDVAQLAGGIAHHFNNILTAVIGYGSLLQMKMGLDDPLRAYVEHMVSSSEMAADLTKKLLAFSGQQKMNPKLTDLNDTVREARRLFPLFINRNIRPRVQLTNLRLPVMVDATLVEEAIVNLISNAVDAMPSGGELMITTERCRIGNGTIDGENSRESTASALLTIADTGVGMTRRVKERMFDPFFTTKEVGKGIGLGLSAVYGIIKQHNGRIEVESRVGKGTQVGICLPIVMSQVEAKASLDIFGQLMHDAGGRCAAR